MEAATVALDVRKEALETIVTLLEQPPFSLLHFEADSYDTVKLRTTRITCELLLFLYVCYVRQIFMSFPLLDLSCLSVHYFLLMFFFSSLILYFLSRITQVVLTSAQVAFSELAKQHPVIAALFDSRSSDEVSGLM